VSFVLHVYCVLVHLLGAVISRQFSDYEVVVLNIARLLELHWTACSCDLCQRYLAFDLGVCYYC